MRVIVFSLSGCPARWLGAYGNEWVATPHLDRLASQSVVFDRHISDCPHPDAARVAWLTGQHQFCGPTLEFTPQLLMKLRAAGVRTVLVRANHADTDGPSPFYAGWDEVFDTRPDPADRSPLDCLLREFPGVQDRLKAVPRWLLWVETDRLIPPWNVPQDVFEVYLQDVNDEEEDASEARPTDDDEDDEDDEDEITDDQDETEEAAPEEVEVPVLREPEERVEPFADPPTGPFDGADPDAWEWLRTSFAAVVTTFDAELGRLEAMLQSHGLTESAALLLTSDFGYPLGEHGQIGLHRPWLHEELVHLPLMLRLPSDEQAGRRVPALTQPADLAATLLDLFGFVSREGDGQSLLPLARGQAEKLRDAACTSLELDGIHELAIRTHEWALLVPISAGIADPPRQARLFQKPDDYWEVNDLRTHHAEIAEELEARVRAIAAKRIPEAP